MAFANSAITDIIATTIQSRSGELADNLTQNNAILQRLNQKGNVRPFSGGNVILEEIMYNDPNTNNANSYSGYEVLNIAPDSPISAAQYKIAQYADSVTMSGLEMLQNSSKEAIIDLLDGRMQVSEARLLNRISGDLYLDGTGNSGKNITGLGAARFGLVLTAVVGAPTQLTPPLPTRFGEVLIAISGFGGQTLFTSFAFSNGARSLRIPSSSLSSPTTSRRWRGWSGSPEAGRLPEGQPRFRETTSPVSC